MSASSYVVSAVSAASPDMDARSFDEFVEDIRANGQLVPIWVRGDEVIDGRKRLAACQQLGIEPKVVNLDPEQDAERISRALNVLRTHYSPSQRAMYAGARANATIRDGRSFHKSSPTKNSGAVLTLRQAAAEVGVAQSYVIAAKRVIRDAAPEVTTAVRTGSLTLHAAEQIVAAIPKEDQAAAVVKVVESSRGNSRHTPVAKVLDGVGGDPRRDRAIVNPKHEQFALAVQKLEVGAELITKYADAAAQDVRRREFLITLREVRTAISRAINLLEVAA